MPALSHGVVVAYLTKVYANSAYEHGALLVNGATVNYYSAARASLGWKIGAQQYAHALFFMTDNALYQFRTSPGWEAGGDIEYALRDRGGNLTATTPSGKAWGWKLDCMEEASMTGSQSRS